MLTFTWARACALQGHSTTKTPSITFIWVRCPIHTTDGSVVLITDAVCSWSKTVYKYCKSILFLYLLQIIFLLQKLSYYLDFKYLEKIDRCYTNKHIFVHWPQDGWIKLRVITIFPDNVYTVKKDCDFSIASRDVNNKTLPARNNLIIPGQGEFG
jgi:hypothetical protein